jgi:SrtB family sortase
VEIYRIAQSVAQSEAAIQAYRTVYLKENNVDFMRGAVAVALRPPGETYPPTASPVPVQTPSPTPRIAQNDPLIAAMSEGGLSLDQSVAPGELTPAPRSALVRYPLNPLLVVRDDIAALQTENPDIVGRLTIEGVLNELVVQRNNTYYLNHNAMGAYSGYGAVFADENVNFRVPPENIVLYARTATEGKTFAALIQYESQGIEFAGRYAFLSLDTLYEQARYVIIAVVKTDADPASDDALPYRQFTFATDGDMLTFARDAMEQSLYGFSVGVLPTDRLLTLITLSDGSDSSGLVILCRMLRDGESDGVLQQDAVAP